MTASEQYLLGCCLLDEGASLDLCLASNLRAADFSTHSGLYRHLCALRQEHIPIGLDTLLPRLNGEANVVELMALADPAKIGTTAHLQHHLRQVQEDSARRRIITQSRSAIEAAERGDPIEEITPLFHVELPSEGKSEQRKLLESRRVQKSRPPTEPITRLFLAGKPIATGGNLQTITSKAKTGKTVTTGAVVASIIAATTSTLDRDTFKFRASNPKGQAVIVLDTEQSPYDAFTCYQRNLVRSGDETDPAWLHHYALVGYSVQQRKQALELALSSAREEHGAVFLVILDGVGDFVMSVNDEVECNGLADWLRALSVQYDCPIMCVIHSNESVQSGDDARGHIGKQLIRVSETNLLLKKVQDITTITSDKQRKAPITEADNVAFQWSDEQQMHASTQAVSTKGAKGGRGKLHTIHEFWECIPAKGSTPMTGTALHRYAVQVADIKPNTFKDLLADATKEGLLTRVYDAKTGFSYIRAL